MTYWLRWCHMKSKIMWKEWRMMGIPNLLSQSHYRKPQLQSRLFSSFLKIIISPLNMFTFCMIVWMILMIWKTRNWSKHVLLITFPSNSHLLYCIPLHYCICITVHMEIKVFYAVFVIRSYPNPTGFIKNRRRRINKSWM
jgi:hypothetical protein